MSGGALLARVYAKRFGSLQVRAFTRRADGTWNRVGTLQVTRPEYDRVLRPALVAGGVMLDESHAVRCP